MWILRRTKPYKLRYFSHSVVWHQILEQSSTIFSKQKKKKKQKIFFFWRQSFTVLQVNFSPLKQDGKKKLNSWKESPTAPQMEKKCHIVVPYSGGLCESYKTICSKYSIQVHFKGQTLKSLLVFPKDKDIITK